MEKQTIITKDNNIVIKKVMMFRISKTQWKILNEYYLDFSQRGLGIQDLIRKNYASDTVFRALNRLKDLNLITLKWRGLGDTHQIITYQITGLGIKMIEEYFQ